MIDVTIPILGKAEGHIGSVRYTEQRHSGQSKGDASPVRWNGYIAHARLPFGQPGDEEMHR